MHKVDVGVNVSGAMYRAWLERMERDGSLLTSSVLRYTSLKAEQKCAVESV